ncbi:MAG TPA: cysteine--tRNA ligase [Polyangiaceae bacterium]|jgi:cysteinyl-tRNA synthetase|nr:cysteine--tRNA ligase [Polyangiaceae bacterium]
MKSAMKIYSTLSRELMPVVPTQTGQVRLYYCGPTVYDAPHAGHARSAVVFDVLVRTLRHRGFEAIAVRNITDVDDKILARAKENGEAPLELSSRMADLYRSEMIAVGCLPPDKEPKVSDHLPQIVALIEDLVGRGAAYAVDMPGGTRDVYFSVRGFPDYGKLSRRKLDELVAGARVEADETNKRDPMDFALWKGAFESEWGWDSPWGWGRPGWHIECSAMAQQYLGHGFEIHGGGMDLIFPHHENEVAQSEAAHPGEGPFARCWMHHGFVNVDKEKMSKSLGNFVTVKDVLARNDPEAFRLFLLGVHYRGPIQFDTEVQGERVTFPGVDDAERRLDYLYTTRERLAALAEQAQSAPAKFPKELVAARDVAEAATARADAALDDDLNTTVAIAELGEVAKHANEVCDLVMRRQKDAAFVTAAAIVARGLTAAMARIAGELGLLQADAAGYRERTRTRRLRQRGLSESDVESRVAARVEARRAKDFARSDAIRDELLANGISVHDAPSGSTWTIAV